MEQPAQNDLRERLHRYIIPNPIENVRHQFNQISIMLFGMMGHGKSSLINSCIYVLNNHNFQNTSGAGNTYSASTIVRKICNLTQTLSIVDNRGFSKVSDDEILEAKAQLRRLRNIEEVKWENSYKETLEVFLSHITAAQPTFLVPVLVVSGKEIGEDGKAGLSTFVTDTFQITGIHPILVITHSSSENESRVNQTFRDLGINHRFSLENYTTNNTNRNPDTDKTILQFLDTCISEAERGIKTRAKQKRNFTEQGRLHLIQEIDMKLRKNQNEIESLKKEKEDLSKEKEDLKKEKEDLKKEKEDLKKQLQKEKGKWWFQRYSNKKL